LRELQTGIEGGATPPAALFATAAAIPVSRGLDLDAPTRRAASMLSAAARQRQRVNMARIGFGPLFGVDVVPHFAGIES
jgi:hypothetical protein